jgi:hypothetical protein
MQTLKEITKRFFDLDLPISGGFGNSIEIPIIIHKTIPNDYVSIEYTLLRTIGIGRGIEWKMIQQSLLTHNDRMIDQLKIETKEITETEIITQIENYYFDITECFG